MRPFSAFALVLLALPCANLAARPTTCVQDGTNPAKQVESYKRYLARKPYHDWAFDKLVEAAVAMNGLPTLVEEFEAKLETPGASLADRVVLARLYARTEREAQALEALTALEDRDVALLELIGTLELKRGNTKAAMAALDEAAGLTQDRQQLESIHSKRGQAYLAAGERDKAYGAFKALAELEPENFHLRLESATELAYHGLHKEALIEFTVAEQLAGTDTAKRCKVMSEMGRLQERLQEIEEALATYARAIELMSRGNWLKRDLAGRIVAIHRRTGTLEEMVDAARKASKEHARDLDAVEFLATSLEELRRFEEAAEVLAGAAADFPSDLALSRHRIEVLTRVEDTEGVIAEYQRILEEQPEELDLYLELGRVLASEGRFDAAKRQWNRTLERRLTDPGLCVRLATFYALFDQVDDAVGMYEKAIALEPEELRHYGDLSSLLSVRGRLEDVPGVLERAATAAAGSAARLAELSGLWSQFGDHERAREAVEAALELDVGNPKLLGRLADLLIRGGNLERASDVLHQVVNYAREASLRTSAVDRLVRLYRQADRLEELATREQSAVDADSVERAPYLVLAKMYVGRRDPDRAIRLYERLLELDPDQEDPRKSLARLYEERGDQQMALDQYAALIERQPQARRRYLKEVAKIHLNLLNQDEAFACYDEILASAPDNPAAFKEVADAYKRLGLWDKVIECMQQAVRLKPDDGRLRMDLADAYRQRGEWDKAREHVLEAVASREERVRKRARKGYYLLLSEGGRLDNEIASLRARVEENPYDLEAPLALTDIYQRELEYELAIEVLDGLIILQPREPALLRQRAKLYVLMERFGEAIADFETLWKLPKADHQTLSTDIAEACLESGDLERAKQLMAGVHNLRKVARLYEKHDLPEEAVKVLEKGVAGGAGVGRMMLQLAQIQEDIGDRGSAATTLERMLALQGDSWRVLVRLGNLYHELGRKPESLDIGHRLFAMVRVDEPEENEPNKEDEEEDENKSPWSSSYRSYWQQAGNQRYGERLGQIKQFFETKGYIKEFLDLAVAESKLQPSNAQLLTGIWWVFNQVEDSQLLAYELLEGMRLAVAKSGRIPAGYTKDSWIALLASREYSLYREDSRFAASHLATVDARLTAPGGGSPDDHLRKAKLLEALQRDADRRAALQAGLLEHPESIGLLAALGRVKQLDKDYGGAVETFKRLIPLLEAAKVREAELAELEITFKRRKNSLLQGFAVHIQRRVGDEALRRLFRISTSLSTSLTWGPGQRPRLDGARQGLATCLFKLGRDEEAREAMVSLEPEDPEHLSRWAILANIYYAEEQFEAAEDLYRRVLAIEADLDADPILGFNRSWASPVARSVQNLARILEKRGDLEEACDLFLTYGARNQAELLLTTSAGFEDAAARYRARMQAITGELPSADNVATGDPEDPRLRDWRNLGIMLANVRQFQKRWDDVLAIYQELSERDAKDFTLAENLAALHQRDKNVDAAIAVHRDIIERKRLANRQMERPKRPPGRRLIPTRPPGVASEDYNITRLGRGGYGRAPGLKSVSVNYAAILKLYLDDNRTTEAVALLRQMAREDASSFRYMGYTIRSLISKYQLGSDAVPLLRLLHSYNPTDNQTGMEYGKALVKAQSYDEAHKVYTDLLNKNRNYAYFRDQVTRELDSLEARMGLDQKVTLDDLRANVETDPKNVRTRMKLAKRLIRDRFFEEALAQTRAAEELAPFRDEVKAEIIKCLTVLGRNAELEAALLERRARLKSSDDEKFAITVRLANWALERGDREAADALFEDAFDVRSGGWVNAAPSSWYIQKGFYDEARVRLEQELEAMGGGQWTGEEAKQRLEALYLLQGDPSKAFDQAWKRFEKANGRGGKLVFFKQLPQVIRRLPDPEGSREQVFSAAEKHGGLRGGLYRAAWHLAVADLAGAEAELLRIVAAEEQGDFLYVALLELALERDDVETALAYLDQLEVAVSLSRSRRVNTPLGSVDERKAERMSRASLLLELGRKDEAWAIWDGLFEEEEKEDMRKVMPGLYARFDRYEQAASIVRAQLDEEGEQNYRLLSQLAGYLRQLERPDEAIELLGRALILSGRSTSVRTTLIAAHRENGSLDSYFDELKTEADADPEDEVLQRALLDLAMEIGRDDVALESARRISERADDAASMKHFLMLQRGAAGELERARELQLELLEAGDGIAKKRAARNLAWKRVRDGDLEAAVELITNAYLDVDPLQLQQQLARYYRQAKDYGKLLECSKAMLKLAPKDIASHSTKQEALRELERWEEAIDGIYRILEETKFESSWMSYVQRLGYLSVHFDEVARQAAALLEKPADAAAQRRLAWVLSARKEDGPAIAALSAVLAEDPEQRLALRLLWPFQRKLELFDEAQATIETLLGILDREQAVQAGNWGLRSELSELRHAIGILYFLRGDWSTGLEEWKKPRGQRYEEIQSYMYSYYNSPIQTQDTYKMLAHGLFDEYISARRMDAWFDPWSSQWNREQTVEARFRKGERAAALEDLWNIVAEPGRSLISGGVNNFFIFSAFDDSRVNSEWRVLVRLWQEEGRLEELVARVDTRLKARPDDGTMKGLRSYMRRIQEDWEPLLLLAEEALADKPDDKTMLGKLANTYVELERYADAVPHYERLIRLARGKVQANSNWIYRSSSRSSKGNANRISFTWGAGTSGSGMFGMFGTTIYSSGMMVSNASTEESGLRRTLMALYRKLGRDDEAQAMEQAELDLAEFETRTPASRRLELANAYAKVEATEHVVRLCEQAAELDPDNAVAAWRILSTYWKKLGKHEQARASALKLGESVEKSLRKDPFGLSARLRRGEWRLTQISEPEGAREDALAALKQDPYSTSARVLLGRALLTLGRPADALRELRRAEGLGFALGIRASTDLHYGLGLALHDTDPGAAAPYLRRALAASPKHQDAEIAAALLQ